MRYSLRKAKPSDRAFAEALHKRCYEDVVVRQFGTWDSESQKRSFELEWNPDCYQIIVYHGNDVGVLADERRSDHLYLIQIQIDPSVQNQGIGTDVLTDLCERARSLGLPVRLQVLRCNQAVKLYERMGFHHYGQTETHLLYEKFCKRHT